MVGTFISFEGGEGAGKSTQIKTLQNFLAENGKQTLLTREPGGSDGAEKIRELLVTGDADKWDGITEAMLVFSARRDHYKRTIAPALTDGTFVLCDRFADSSYAYQGAGHGVETAILDHLYTMACDQFRPHLTIVLDVPVDVGIKRALSRHGDENRYESMDTEFHERVRQSFLHQAQRFPERFVVLDATQSPESIATEIQCTVMERFL